MNFDNSQYENYEAYLSKMEKKFTKYNKNLKRNTTLRHGVYSKIYKKYNTGQNSISRYIQNKKFIRKSNIMKKLKTNLNLKPKP